MNYSFTLNNTEVTNFSELSASAQGLIAGMGVGMIILGVCLLIFEIVCMWRVFNKAGEPGWKCLIPIYNMYMMYKIAWKGKYFFYPMLGAILAGVFVGIGAGNNSGVLSGIGSFLMIAVYVAIIVFEIIMIIKLAKCFGKGAGFAVGLILLSPIFMAILAFDKSVYNKIGTVKEAEAENTAEETNNQEQ